MVQRSAGVLQTLDRAPHSAMAAITSSDVQSEEPEYAEVFEEQPNFCFQIDTDSFSADDFDFFISSLEQTYNAQQQPGPIVDQSDNSSEDNSLYAIVNSVNSSSSSSVGGYEGSNSDETVSKSSSLDSFVHSESKPQQHKDSSAKEDQSLISTRKSLLNLFSYFDEDITVCLDEDEPIEYPQSPQKPSPLRLESQPAADPSKVEKKVWSSPKSTRHIPKKQPPVIKNPLCEQQSRTADSVPTEYEPPAVPGRINKDLLKIFESETQPRNNNNNSNNFVISKVALTAQKPPLPPRRKAPIIRNKIDNQQQQQQHPNETRKKVDNGSIGHSAAAAVKLQALRNHKEASPPGRQTSTRLSTVKIVNATRKVDSLNRLQRNLNPASSVKSVNRDRDKCYVQDISQLFLQYRKLLEPTVDPQQVSQAIQHIEKLEPMEEPLLSPPPPQPPVKAARRKTREETAQQIHFRLQNQSYRLRMLSLMDSQHRVQMSPHNREQLFQLDELFNRSSLSLIHMVLSLIRENVLLEDRGVSIDIETSDYHRFVRTMSEGSYGIDSMATSTIRENCVAVEITAIDETSSPARSVKIVILFVIETSDESNRRKEQQQQQQQAGQLRKSVESRDAAAAVPTPDDSDFQITVRMRFEPPENELQKSHETGTNLSEHQLRVQASLQRLNIPDWYKQYSGKDAPNAAAMANSGGAAAAAAAAGGILRKRNSDVGRWTGLSSKTTSLSSLGSHRSDRSPVMLSPSAHSHHGGQTGFSRWSTSHLNSNQTSPSVSTRGSFTRGGLNASVISGYSTASTTVGATAGNSVIRNSFRQPYLGWRSQEKLSQPRTPAERLASSLLSQQKAKEQQQQHHNQQKVDPVVTPEIQSSIKEVTSAIVHYVNDQTNRHSRSRSTSPSQRCWLESSFVGSRPLDSPQTPMIDNSSSTTVVLAGQQQTSSGSMVAGDHYRYNAGRINGVGESTLI